MISALFIILSFLFVLEASTSICRQVGYQLEKPEGGLFLQSTLALLSRVLMFMFMPMLGWMADTGMGSLSPYFLANYIFVIVSLSAFYIYRWPAARLFENGIHRMVANGSLFRSANYTSSIVKDMNKRAIKPAKNLYWIVFVAYIPYYLAWPLVIILISEYVDYRATILGMATVFNGVNTIILTVFVDPVLMKLGKYKRIIKFIYPKLAQIRIYSSIFAFLLCTVFFWIINE